MNSFLKNIPVLLISSLTPNLSFSVDRKVGCTQAYGGNAQVRALVKTLIGDLALMTNMHGFEQAEAHSLKKLASIFRDHADSSKISLTPNLINTVQWLEFEQAYSRPYRFRRGVSNLVDILPILKETTAGLRTLELWEKLRENGKNYRLYLVAEKDRNTEFTRIAFESNVIWINPNDFIFGENNKKNPLYTTSPASVLIRLVSELKSANLAFKRKYLLDLKLPAPNVPESYFRRDFKQSVHTHLRRVDVDLLSYFLSESEKLRQKETLTNGVIAWNADLYGQFFAFCSGFHALREAFDDYKQTVEQGLYYFDSDFEFIDLLLGPNGFQPFFGNQVLSRRQLENLALQNLIVAKLNLHEMFSKIDAEECGL